MNNKNVSLSIRNEIHRFESVHPSIYSIYELLDGIQANDKIVNCIRQHVVNIEDSFVNSQEWTLSRSVKEIRLGILGSVSSGKSSLVHRYLTNTFLEDDSPEGGRFKKEIIINQKPYMLLLRDEGGPPELQFTNWVDGVLLISNSGNTTNTCFSYVTKMASYRSLASIPISVVSIGQENGFESELLKIPHQLHFNCDPVSGHNVEECFLQFSKFVLQFHQQQPQIVRSNSTLSDGRCYSNMTTPTSTPTQTRKEKLSRRKSNLFTKQVGSGRIIPLKQGYLMKKSNHSVVTNVKGHYYGKKKWKKKYVTLSDTFIFYHQSIHEYMEDEVKGKPIDLHKISVKATTKGETTNYGDISYGFQLVSFENKTWEFEASTKEERDQWVNAIEQQIILALQGNVSNKNGEMEVVDPSLVRALRLLPGNDFCADCNSPNPDWASLNLCVLICISCSGIHRNLGTHISKVRSLDLDEWSNIHYSTLKYFNGNKFLNEMYERKKPARMVSVPIKEKYEQLQFIPDVDLKLLKQKLVNSMETQDKAEFLTCLLNISKYKVDIGDLEASDVVAEMQQMLFWVGGKEKL